ncbi:MAG: TonB-dependent receptor [Bacteroidota bacterium]
MHYGVFPSFAAAWNLKNEAFLAGSDLFDDLKLRVGWGITGNQEFPAGASTDRFALDPVTGVSQENIGNPDLQWEQSTTLNIGIDFSLLDYRVTGTLEYYNRVTDNLLLDPFVQEPGPPIRAWRNIDGELVNSGVELGLNAYLIEKENFGLNIALNLAFLTNEFRNYDGPDILTGNLFGQGSSGAFVQKHVNGSSLNTYFVRDFQGLDDNGTNVFGNNGDPVLTEFDPNADIIAGFTLGITSGQWSFSANFNGAFGHQLYNNTAMSVIPISNLGTRNVDAALLGGSVLESRANPITSSSRFLEDGDFVKLSNATLSYSLGSIGSVKDITFSLTGQNLFVITDYTGFDPEVNTVNLRNGVPSNGIEYIPYPSARTILFGVSANF